MANTKLLEREIHNLAAAKARRVTLYIAVGINTSAAKLDVLPRPPPRRSSRRGCKLVRCVATGVGSAHRFELVYDDGARQQSPRENRSAVLLDLIEQFAPSKIELVRASDMTPPLAPF